MIILAIGTNIGDKVQNIKDALAALNRIGCVEKVSPVYETEPWGFASDNGFLNLVITFKCNLPVMELLTATQQIERDLGRKAKTSKEYADRPIDIDIIDYNGLIVNTNELVLPHRLMQERNFVLYPLSDIAPDWIHPVFNKTAERLKLDSPDDAIPAVSDISL